MKDSKRFIFRGLTVAVTASLLSFAAQAETEPRFPVNNPEPQEGQFVHVPPTMEDLENADMHPELKRVIRRGHDLFMNTQQLREIGRAHV